MADTPRWHLRFENFELALSQLESSVALSRAQPLSDLEQAGLIKQFEYTWELGWKSMRDYLIGMGTRIQVPVAANVIRAANEVDLIQDNEGWFEARNARNQMSHEYGRGDAKRVVADIRDRFLPLLTDLRRRLADERERGN